MNLESMFDVVIKLDFTIQKICLQKLDTDVEFPDLYNGCEMEVGISFLLNYIVSTDDENRLLTMLRDVQNGKHEYQLKGFKFKKGCFNGAFCNGTIISCQNCCWVCFNNAQKDLSGDENNSAIELWINDNIESIKSNLEMIFFGKTEVVRDNNETFEESLIKYISDIVFQSFVYVSQSERADTKKKQAIGIQNAHERGVKFGRQKKEIPKNFHKVYNLYSKGKLSSREAGAELGVSHSTFLKWTKEICNK